MGFYVDVKEIKELTEHYLKAADNAQTALDDARKGMNGIITSNAMYGEVGKAITNDINNNQNAVIVGLKDSYKILGAEFQQTLQDFLSTTGESSENAILDEEVITKVKTDLDNMEETHEELRKEIKAVYEDIADLIDLPMPANTFKEKKADAKKHLTKIITNVTEYDSKQTTSSTAEVVSALSQQVSLAEQANELSYTDPHFKAFAEQNQLANAIKEIDDQITAQEKQAKIEEEKAAKKKQEKWAEQHPFTSWLQDRSEEIGNFWDDVVSGTKALPLNDSDKQLLVTLEGFIGRAGETVSSIAIGASELVQLGGELLNGLDHLVLGTEMPQWQLDDLRGAWENTKSIGATLGTVGLGTLTMNNSYLQSVPIFNDAKKQTITMGKKLLGEIWNSVKNGDSYAIGGYIFDVASMFVGVGEVSAVVKGSSWGLKLTEGMNAFKAAAKVNTFNKLSKLTTSLNKALSYGDDALKAFGNKLSKIPVPIMDEVVTTNGVIMKVSGKGKLGDYAKILQSDAKVTRGVKKASGLEFGSVEKLETHFSKHGSEMKQALNKKNYSIADYLSDANHVIKEGQFVPEMNGYIKLVGGEGSAKYAFVGLDRTTGNITTLHLKSVKELAKKAPSLGLKP